MKLSPSLDFRPVWIALGILAVGMMLVWWATSESASSEESQAIPSTFPVAWSFSSLHPQPIVSPS